MECAGFFQAATGFATLELVQAVKIISDNAGQPMEGVAPKLISRLMVQNLHVVEEITQQLLSLSKHQQRLNDPGPDYHAITKERHFSVSQQHQLQALTQKMASTLSRRYGIGRALGRAEFRQQRSSVFCATNWKRPPSGSVNATERTKNTFPDGLY